MPNRRSSLVAGRLLVAIAIGLACSVAAPLSCHAQSAWVDGQPTISLTADTARRGGDLSALKQSVVRGGARCSRICVPTLSDTAGGTRLSALTHSSNIVASRPKFQYLAPLGGLILGYVGGTIDHDAGGYRDSFKFQPDKQAHLLASVVLAKAVADGTSVKVGLATCLLAGAAWEAGQRRHHGYASGFDFTYDSVGCLAGALWGRK